MFRYLETWLAILVVIALALLVPWILVVILVVIVMLVVWAFRG